MVARLPAWVAARREAYALADVRVLIESDNPANVVEEILSHPLIL